MSSVSSPILLMRHPQSKQNANGLKMFDIGDPDLTIFGEMQAHATGFKLAQRIGETLIVDTIVTSPALRAVKAADIVGRYLPWAEIEIDERLGEINWGDWAGKLQSDVMTPDVQKQADDAGLGFCPPGGESMLQGHAKFAAAVAQRAGHNVLYVSHGFKTKSYVAGELNMTRRDARKIPVLNGQVNAFDPLVELPYRGPDYVLASVVTPLQTA